MAHSPPVGLCPQCGAGWTGSPCPACGYVAPVPVDFQARPFEPVPAPRDEADRLADIAAQAVIDWWDNDGEAKAFRQIYDSVGDPPVNAKHAAEYACDVFGSLLRRDFAPLAAAPRADPPDDVEAAKTACPTCRSGRLFVVCSNASCDHNEPLAGRET